MRPLVLGRPRVEGSLVRVPVDPGATRGYVRGGDFWVDYSGSEQLGVLDEGLLVAPALGAVVTAAYALGVPVQVDRIDTAYAAGVDELAGAFGALYASFATDGFRLRGQRVETVQPPGGGAALLFSGGLDSTSSLIAHRSEVRDLLTVWGADVGAGDTALWGRLHRQICSSRITDGLHHVVARTNLHEVVDGLRLTRRFGHEFRGGNWWGGAQHGVALTSLLVPVAARRGRDTIYIASSATASDAPVPWGSLPAIDNKVRWSSGRVVHDQYDLSRQAKVDEVIAPYVAAGGRLAMSVCYQQGRDRDGGLNCGLCEKCLRTVSGLLAAGIEPQDVGVPVSGATLRHARAQLTARSWHGDADHQAMWTDIQAAVPAELAGLQAEPDVREYLEWLRTAPLDLVSPTVSTRWTRAQETAWYLTRRASRHLPLGLRLALNKRLAVLRSRLLT